jgi:hypothetical protein
MESAPLQAFPTIRKVNLVDLVFRLPGDHWSAGIDATGGSVYRCMRAAD